MTVRGCFGIGTACVKGTRRVEKRTKKERWEGGRKERKKEEENKMTKLNFHRFRLVNLVTISSNLLATVRWGNAGK